MYASPFWYFKDAGFRFKAHVSNKRHDVLTNAYELKDIAILSVAGVDFRRILWGITKDEAVNRLKNSALEEKSLL